MLLSPLQVSIYQRQMGDRGVYGGYASTYGKKKKRMCEEKRDGAVIRGGKAVEGGRGEEVRRLTWRAKRGEFGKDGSQQQDSGPACGLSNTNNKVMASLLL